MWWPERSILVLAVMLRQNTPYRTKMQTSASVCILERTSSGMDETCRLRRGEDYEACEDEPPEAQLRYYRILPHAGACQQPLRQNLRFCHLPLHRGGFGADRVVRPFFDKLKCPEALPQGICHIVCSGEMGCSSVRYRTRQ